ncbi:MAG: NifB/NifX family molybdenum-iron cluster-binding protein [Candidatus Nanopelagicales bacterium]
MIVLIPVTPTGQVDPRFGKAAQVALAEFDASGELTAWRVTQVNWDEAHDQGTHGAHHARIVRFLKESEVDLVAAAHIGEGMRRTLEAMALPVALGVGGDARQAAQAAAELLIEAVSEPRTEEPD